MRKPAALGQPRAAGAASRGRSPAVDLDGFMSDPALFEPWFRGESWATWRAILRSAFGKPLSDEELELFHAVAGDREPPRQAVTELWVQGGRRVGKDSVASTLAAWFAVQDYSSAIRPGEIPCVMLLAVDKEQSQICLSYTKAFFQIPMLRALVRRETQWGLELTNGVEIVIVQNNYRSVRGRTIVCCILDECSFWRDEASAAPDVETYRALLPSLATVPGSMLIAVSSPYKKSGLLYSKSRTHYGQPHEKVLFVKGASRQFNPTISQETVEAAIAEDPEAAQSEWLGEPRSDLADFVDRATLERCVSTGVAVRQPIRGLSYCAFCDPSGGSVDSMVLAIGHREQDLIIVDCLVERRAPFSPDDTVREFSETLAAYSVSTISGDRYGGSWPAARFSAHGIMYVPAEKNRSELYLAFLPLVNSARVDLIDNPRMITQFSSLERRTSRVGRDVVDHPKNGHDDCANCVAGLAFEIESDRRPMLIAERDLVGADGSAPSWPQRQAETIFATFAADDRKHYAVVYGAAMRRPNPLLIVDFCSGPFHGAVFREIDERLRDLMRECGAGGGLLLLPAGLMRNAELAGVDAAPIPEDFDPSQAIISASQWATDGRVKITAPCQAKMRTSPLGGALGFRLGDLADDTPLRVAFLACLSMKLDPALV